MLTVIRVSHPYLVSFPSCMLILCALALISGCNLLPQKSTQPALSPADKAPFVPKREEKAFTRTPSKEKIVHQLIRQAQNALKKDQLTSPSHNNAYDLFQSVLALDSQHRFAKAGLESILIRYANFTRKAIAERDIAKADRFIGTVNEYFPGHPMVAQLQADKAKALKKTQHHRAPLYTSKPENPQARPEFYAIDEAELSKRTRGLQEYLTRIARRIESTEESVLIYAKTDAQGRWIYQQLNKASKKYRVRGDIRIASSAKIVLLAPLR